MIRLIAVAGFVLTVATQRKQSRTPAPIHHRNSLITQAASCLRLGYDANKRCLRGQNSRPPCAPVCTMERKRLRSLLLSVQWAAFNLRPYWPRYYSLVFGTTGTCASLYLKPL